MKIRCCSVFSTAFCEVWWTFQLPFTVPADVALGLQQLSLKTFSMVIRIAWPLPYWQRRISSISGGTTSVRSACPSKRLKEEYKQTEGDPQVKGKIKEAQRRMAQSRMMQKVPEADVVIRNPTHFAVALRYKPDKDSAPVVLAKGQDYMALRIVKIAEEAKVSVVENVSLARALYASTEVGREIPPELYNAVAEVLVYLYRLNNK